MAKPAGKKKSSREIEDDKPFTMVLPDEVKRFIKEGGLFAVSHSAGKDSQAMLLAMLKAGIPKEQMVLVHADLGDVEWEGNIDHIKANSFGIPLIVAEPKSDFWTMVNRRQMFPSPSQRQCTSDLKRGPIERELRRYLKENPQFGGKVINCMGMRAAESAARAKRPTFIYSKSNSKAGREWYDWLPIHAMSTKDVFRFIQAEGQKPHPAYSLGMSRLSCCFCIMANQKDLTIAAKANPELYGRYVELERQIDHTLAMSRKFLPEVTGMTPEQALEQAVRLGEGPDMLPDHGDFDFSVFDSDDALPCDLSFSEDESEDLSDEEKADIQMAFDF